MCSPNQLHSCMLTWLKSEGRQDTQDTRQAWLRKILQGMQVQDKCRASAGQVQESYRITTGHPHWQAGHLQTCNMITQSVGSIQFCVEKGHLLKTRMSNFYFVTLGLLAHAVLVWCGVRATGLTTGQVQDKCRTTTGRLQDNYRTTTGHCPTAKPAPRTRLRTLSYPASDLIKRNWSLTYLS